MVRTLSCAGSVDVTGSDQENIEGEMAALRKEVAMLRLVNAELERIVVRDTLTPLYNRRYFISALNERIARARRYAAQSVAIIIDINHMKHINDAFGHPAGDYTLMQMAQILSRSVRASDVAARIGGDEFALILDELDERGGNAKIAALDAITGSTQCTLGAAEWAVSASFGATLIRGDDSDSDVLARADEAMYAQKRRRFAR